MVKNIFILSLLISLFGCGQKLYKIERDKYGEPLLNDKARYTFTEIPTLEDLKKIDISAYYVQVFEGRYYNENEIKNPRIIIFHDDGFFRQTSLLAFGKFDKYRGKNSVYYGGKYRINGKLILMEHFLPSSQGQTKWYIRSITKGSIEEGNRIIFNEPGLISVFEKRKELPKIVN